MRRRIGHRQDVVEPVAIIAGGDFGCGVRQAQRHRLAVVGLAVMLQPVSVAFAAALVAQGLEILAGRVDDLVRAVTVNANRSARVALREQLTVDTLIVDRLNADVALAAGLGDVGVVDRRIAVHAALYFVRAMAIIARGRDDQPHLQQRRTVDAVYVLIRGLGKFDLVFLGEIRVAMTLGASRRQIHFIDGRTDILHRQNFVAAMAVPAFRRAGRAH